MDRRQQFRPHDLLDLAEASREAATKIRDFQIDLELPDGTKDEEYLEMLDSVLPRVAEFAPEIVFYLSGVDALESDVLGRLSLTLDGLKARDHRVIGECFGQNLPLVITLAGGYSNPIELTVEAHANTFRVAAEIYMTHRATADFHPLNKVSR